MQTSNNYEFLEKKALELGVGSARVIPVDKIVVEDRVRLRCSVGCPSYGNNLKCPPFVPTSGEFRNILKDYRFALVVKHKPDVLPEEVKGLKLHDREKANQLKAKLWPAYHAYYEKTLDIMLELEREAFAHGCLLAIAFYGGSCSLCESCNVKEGVCRYPTKARIAAEAVGVNVAKTAEKAGLPLIFSMEVKPPEPVAILLID